MTDGFLFGKSLVAAKAVVALGPMAGYLAVEWLTGNVGLGLIASGFFSMLTAFFVTRPTLIAARAAALVQTTQAEDGHLTSIVDRMTRIHQQEIAFWKDAVDHHKKIEVLIRATKHKAFGAYQDGILAIRAREDMLKDAGIPFEQFKPISFREITGDEDRKMVDSLFDKEENNE